MEPALYPAPLGLDAIEEPMDLEIEIEDPESVAIGIDGVEIILEPEKESLHHPTLS